MIISGLLLQAVFLFVVVGLTATSIVSSDAAMWSVVGVAAAVFNLLALWEFRRKHRTGSGGFFFVLRGFYRILHGRETYLPRPEGETADADRGFEVLPPK